MSTHFSVAGTADIRAVPAIVIAEVQRQVRCHPHKSARILFDSGVLWSKREAPDVMVQEGRERSLIEEEVACYSRCDIGIRCGARG